MTRAPRALDIRSTMSEGYNTPKIGRSGPQSPAASEKTTSSRAVLAALRALPAGSVVLLHACAHNPTGVDPTPEQWDAIATAVGEAALVPLIDAAYQGLASGRLGDDAYGARALMRVPGVELIAVQARGAPIERAAFASAPPSDAPSNDAPVF